MIETCSICMADIIDDPVSTSNCQCNVKYHKECLLLANEYGYDCVICRNKKIIQESTNLSNSDDSLIINMPHLYDASEQSDDYGTIDNYIFHKLSVVLFIIIMIGMTLYMYNHRH